MRSGLPLVNAGGRRSSITQWVMLAMIGMAVVACGGGSSSSEDSGTSGGSGRGGRGGGGGTSGDSIYGRTFAIHSEHCTQHAKAFGDSIHQRSFLEDCQNRARAASRASLAFMLAGEMMLTIPEYHDEQAFPVGTGKYGPVASFYASPYLGSFTETWQIAEHGQRGILAAVIDVPERPEGATLEAPYDSLNIKGGLNCLWLALDAGKWRAYVSQTPARVACNPAVGTRKELAVVRSNSEAGYGKGDYPAVTRFTESAIDAGGNLGNQPGRPLLGVSCIDRWCEIGPFKADGVTPDFFVSDPAGPIGSPREHRIKGWHDQQWLAVKVGTQLQPAFRATFIPARKINEKSADDFKAPAWITVATVVLSADPPAGSKYDKLGLKRGRNGLEVQAQGTDWKGRWRNGGTLTPVFKVDHVQHFDAAVPGTARFRWQSNDDSMWAPCGQACCRVEPIM